jgi:ArsR family transcriptional regulator, arsenate/arsenite/antimonite-responsive transcriptional repressor
MTKRPKCCRIDTSKVAGLLKAISDPTRLQILCLLRRGKRCVCELQEDTGLKHNLICHHMKALGKLGILKATHMNKYTFYELSVKNYKKLVNDLNLLLGGCK